MAPSYPEPPLAAATLRATERLQQALTEVDPVDPFSGAAELLRRRLGMTSVQRQLLDTWNSRARGNPTGAMRYRWELSHRRGVKLPSFSSPAHEWRAWRPAEQPLLEKDPFAFEELVSIPIASTHNCEVLVGARDPVADALLDEAAPTMRRDFAFSVQGLRPWADTFALWCLTRSQPTLQRLYPIAHVIAAAYAATAVEGVVRGLRFPFHDHPLVSASAHLASALLVLGTDLPLAAKLCATVACNRSSKGAWGDAPGGTTGSPSLVDGPQRIEPQPNTETSDILTTLVCADLVSRTDPNFDPGPTQRWFMARQQDGLWSVLGPEALWLTGEILGWCERSQRPFANRFDWPYLLDANRDRKTGLPFFAYLVDLATLFAAMPGLAKARTELAFFDLIGFRAFNNDQGQQRGDDVLRCFAEFIAEVPSARAVRDGGDEFLLISAPTRSGLAEEVRDLRRAWRQRFIVSFGPSVPLVTARALLGSTTGDHILAAREHLGREVTALKEVPGDSEGGPIVDLGTLFETTSPPGGQ